MNKMLETQKNEFFSAQLLFTIFPCFVFPFVKKITQKEGRHSCFCAGEEKLNKKLNKTINKTINNKRNLTILKWNKVFG